MTSAHWATSLGVLALWGNHECLAELSRSHTNATWKDSFLDGTIWNQAADWLCILTEADVTCDYSPKLHTGRGHITGPGTLHALLTGWKDSQPPLEHVSLWLTPCDPVSWIAALWDKGRMAWLLLSPFSHCIHLSTIWLFNALSSKRGWPFLGCSLDK